MASKYKESANKDEVMSGDDYFVYSRDLSPWQKDFSGLIIGEYLVIEPIGITNYSSLLPVPTSGWLCKNINTNCYRLFTNLALNKIYIKYCSNEKYFGMEYVLADMKSLKLTPDQFRIEFLSALEEEHAKRTDEYSIASYHEEKGDLEKYVRNVQLNLETLRKLDKTAFETELNRVVEKYHFVETKDISSYKKCLYLIVLDEYKQFYVGKAKNSLKNRMRQHWTAKIIPSRHLWDGGFDYSRIKFDSFKMFDATRIFVCEDVHRIIEENINEALDERISITNTFGFEKFEEMNELAKAERIVINNCKCKYCLSDRTPLMSFSIYGYLEEIYGVSRNDLLIKNYLRLDEKEPMHSMGLIWEKMRKNNL